MARVADVMLAIETSSARGSVAVGRGGQLLVERMLVAERKHTGELLPAIRDTLAEVNLAPPEVGVMAFSQGPGSFTGLRVAATIARVWQSATGSRVVGVPSLDVIGYNAWEIESLDRIAVVIDARHGRLFGALYARGEETWRSVQPAQLREAEPWLRDLPRPCGLTGAGVSVWQDTPPVAGLQVITEQLWLPRAAGVLALAQRRVAAGEFLRPEQILPAYLRPPECEEVYERRRAEARARRGE